MRKKHLSDKIIKLIKSALKEDIGRKDITSHSIISPNERCDFIIALKEDAVICGMDIVLKVFEILKSDLKISYRVKDGEYLSKNSILLKANGIARNVLSGERVALNFLQRLSGIATLTRKYYEEIKNTKAKLLDTRKTTPLLRDIEKYAVKVGGGENHRFGLFDAVLIKENHLQIEAKRSERKIFTAVKKAKDKNKNIKVEVEVSNLDELKEALDAGADIILLDNMSVLDVKKSVMLCGGKAKLEASGGITLENIRKYAITGIDYISVGALTHSFKSIDITLRVF